VTDKWWDRALCSGADPGWFFPGESEPNAYEMARQYCQRCPVRIECLKDAVEYGSGFGMWGGSTARDRQLATDFDDLIVRSSPGHAEKPGTLTGYYRERAAGMKPCYDCTQAYNAHQTAKRKAAA
jgi:WhiB family redox-sensing transcriptional regulator